MHWFSQISGRKSFKSSAPAIVLAEQNGKQLQFTKGALNTAYKYLPPEPIPLTGDNEITIKSMRGAPVKVNECLSLFVTTWNLAGSISVPESDSEISCWIPKGHGLYAISLQDCRKPDQLEAAILKYLGGNTAYQKYKTKEIAGTTLLVFVDQMLNRTGVFKMNHINGLTKHEVKTGKLGGSSNGRGAVCMRFTFHNTVIAFIACKLDSKSPEKREADLEFILKDTGVDTPEVQEIGTPALAKVHHVFLFGDFGTRILYPPKSSLKSLVPHVSNPDSPWDPARWENLLQYDELDELQVKNVCFSGFREPVINYPPTGWRRKWDDASTKSKSSRNGKATSVSGSRASAASGVDEEPLRGAPRIASLFEANFNLDDLFDLKSGGAHTLPTYSDRIFFRTLKDFQHLISFGTSGTAEGMIYAAHVPVFATFKINGVDKTLLHSWQKITGNIPPEYATRADRHLVAGVVAQVQEIVQGQIAAAAAAAAEAEAEAEEMKTAPKCAMCNLPCLRKDTKVLDLPGGKKAHADCFKCETCGKSLVGEKFYNVENRWLCENDFSQSYTKSCPQCGKPVTSQFLRIGNNQFHIECFTCSKAGCGKKLVKQDTGEFEPFDELGGKPYCMEHYKEQTSLLTFCAACNRIILEGEAAVPHVRKTMNGEETSYFHESCFHCKVCHEDLGRSEKKFVISDGEMYCEPDFINLFGPLPKPPTTNSPTASTLPPATEVAAAE